MSKERRVDPQILFGLLVDPNGLPLEIHEFEGNKAETRTLSRVSSAPYDLADRHLKHQAGFTDGQILETTRIMGPKDDKRSRRVVWQYSQKRHRRDTITVTKQIERAENVADGTRPVRKDRFVKLGGPKPQADWGPHRESSPNTSD